MSPGQQARYAAQARGIIQTRRGYTSFPWQTHPNDQFVRVFPDGPYSLKWTGVQKINLMSSVGTLRAARYGTQPVYLQQKRTQFSRIQYNNTAGGSFVGTGPAAQQWAQDEYTQSGTIQSFTQLVLGRLRYGRR